MTAPSSSFVLGNATGAAMLNISSGTLTVTGSSAVLPGNGGAVTWNQTGGTAIFPGQVNFANFSPGQMTISGGTFTVAAGTFYNGATGPAGSGTITINNANGGGSLTVPTLQFGYSGAGTNTLNLDGGTLAVNAGIGYGGSGTATLNFNGGTFQVGGNFTPNASVQTVVEAGGAVINTGTNTLTLSAGLTDGGGGGGLNVSGSGTLVLNGANDIMAQAFNLSFNGITWFTRIAIFVLPPLAFLATRRFCLGLQRRDRELVLHGRESGQILRLPHGEYIEVHTPISDAEKAKILTKIDYPVIEAPAATDEHGVATPGYKGKKRRARFSRMFFGDNVAVPTAAEIAEAEHHTHELHDHEVHELEEAGKGLPSHMD